MMRYRICLVMPTGRLVPFQSGFYESISDAMVALAFFAHKYTHSKFTIQEDR